MQPPPSLRLVGGLSPPAAYSLIYKALAANGRARPAAYLLFFDSIISNVRFSVKIHFVPFYSLPPEKTFNSKAEILLKLLALTREIMV